MTARQFYIILCVMVISIKVQKLPSLIAQNLEKNTYLVILLYLAVNLVLICLAFLILKRTKNLSLSREPKNLFLKIIKAVLFLGITIYFLSQTLLLYEAIQNLFSHVLFYELPWTMFSLMLAFAVFYLALTGIKNISLNFELYFGIILVAYIIISIFGGTKTDFASILPLKDIDSKVIIDNILDYNIWFGDFFLVLFLGKCTDHAKLKWTALVYTLSMLFVALLYIEFFGIYEGYTPMKPSLVSVLSEQSMLGVNIGRIDWFFILFTEIGTILSAGACLYFAKQSLSFAFPKFKSRYILIVLTAVIYFVDIFYLVDIYKQEELFATILPYIMLILKLLLFFIIFIYVLFRKQKQPEEEIENCNDKVLENIPENTPENMTENMTENTRQCVTETGGRK